MIKAPILNLITGFCAVALLCNAGCARRMVVSTGTTIGLNANPGDGQTQTPQVTLAYKRSEIAFVPTGEKQARKGSTNSDAYSSLAIVDFRTGWWKNTAIDQFIATGHASRDIQAGQNPFTAQLAKAASARITLEDFMISKVVKVVDDGSGKVSQAKFNQIAAGTPLAGASDLFVGKPVTKFETFLKKQEGRPFAEQLYNNIQ